MEVVSDNVVSVEVWEETDEEVDSVVSKVPMECWCGSSLFNSKSRGEHWCSW